MRDCITPEPVHGGAGMSGRILTKKRRGNIAMDVSVRIGMRACVRACVRVRGHIVMGDGGQIQGRDVAM